MAKADIVYGREKDKAKWPIAARLCHSIYRLAVFLRTETYFAEIDSDTEFTGVSDEKRNELLTNATFYDRIIELAFDLDTYYSVKNSKIYLDSTIFDLIFSFGTTLADSKWWARYQEISGTMGTDCILSKKTAMSMFEHEKLMPKIKKHLKDIHTELRR